MSDYYPITITEARYSGTYENGPWVLVAGVPNPRENLDAFAGDIPCLDFWRRVREEGPYLEIEHPVYPSETREIVVMADSDPATLWERFEDEIRTYDEEYEERYDFPDIEDVDFEDFEREDKRDYTEEAEQSETDAEGGGLS